MNPDTPLIRATEILRASRSTLIFTGAGISVKSGIPPFRGTGGLWEQVDPSFIEIGFFLRHPEESWRKIREIFYDNWGKAKPNAAHYALAGLQKEKRAQTLVTQNIDCLHQRAGSKNVITFHGSLDRLICLKCGDFFPAETRYTGQNMPACPHCGGLLKPDVVFFGEGIPEDASDAAFDAARRAEAVLVAGTSGEVMPAAMIPRVAKQAGAEIIEINPEPSAFVRDGVTTLFLQGQAEEILPELVRNVCAS